MADYIRLFENEEQGSGTAVSEVFRTDQDFETQRALRIIGTLDGGTLKIQTLDPSVEVSAAIDANWIDTDDTITLPSYWLMPFQRVNFRLKATSLGVNTDFTVDLLINKK